MEYVFLWLYAICYVAIWVYLPIAEWKTETPVLRWFSQVIHSMAAASMIAYLTGVRTSGVPPVWWALLIATATVTVLEDVEAYKRNRKNPEPRFSNQVNIAVVFVGCALDAIARVPCLVVLYRLAMRD